MQNISQQPCHPRIKRILNSYQQWAEHSLKGPSDSVEVRASVDVAPVCQSKSSVSDVVRGALIKANLSRNDVVNSAAAAAPVKVEPCRIRTVSTSSFDSGDVERVAPKKVAKIVGQRMSDAVPNRPLLMAAEGAASYRLTETMLKDQPISCFNVGGERRLCMPQVLSKVLYSFSPARIQSASDELRINFAECNAGQLEALKRRSVLPAGVARCGLITQTDAERLCAILLGSQPAACSSRLDSTAIPVAHECFGGCRGVLLPREYKSPTSSCIECLKCNGRMNPAEFVSHTHSHREDQICHWGFDVSNWRFYLMVSQDDADASEVPKLQKTLDDLKLCFMGKEVSQNKDHASSTVRNAKMAKLELTDRTPTVSSAKLSSSSTDQSCKWKPVNVYTTWAACLNVVQELKHAQHDSSTTTLPPHLFNDSPILDHPDRVIPYEDADRYDRNYAPNVSLAAEPFDELRKLRPDDESDDCDVIETATAVNCMSGVPPSAFPRRRSTHSSSDVYYSPDDDDDDEDYDTESVSSDKLEADRETMAESDVPQLLSVDTEGQMDFVRSAIFDIGADMDPSVKQSLIDRFAAMQDRNVQMIKSLDGTQFTLGQALREVWSLLAAQRREADAARRRFEDELSRQRQEGAARMREAAFERHRLLQQIEALSSANTSSDQAVMAARYKEEAEHWKSRLEEAEGVNVRLQQELAELRKALVISQQQPQTVWMSAAAPTAAEGGPVIAILLTDDQNQCGDMAITPPQSL